MNYQEWDNLLLFCTTCENYEFEVRHYMVVVLQGVIYNWAKIASGCVFTTGYRRVPAKSE